MQFRIAKPVLVISILTAILMFPAFTMASGNLVLSAVKAPVVPDGTTAGAVTDFVITFADLDPDIKGISLHKGATVEVKLDSAFTNLGGGPNTIVLLQGWPQSPPAPPPFLWTTSVVDNTITATLNEDYKVGQFGPGAKQAHLILFGFENPTLPGVYPIELTINPSRGNKNKKGKLSGSSSIRIIPDARPSVEPISLFSGPPGPPPPFFNPIYQTLEVGDSAKQVGLYLWDANSVPFVGVDIQATASPTYYQLVDGAAAVVGEVWITAPSGATLFSLVSVPLEGGPPSVPISAFITGVPVGLLGIQFIPDPGVAGDYEIAISMKGGNEKMLFITVNE